MQQSIETRLQKAERRFGNQIAGVHRLSDAELHGLIAWLKQPDPADEQWVVSVLRREKLIP